jgi:SecD/SecF fusion protein
LTPEMVNTSINQTFSRTVLTGGSTILASIILFVLGGTGIQPFAFTFFIGLIVGTYSSVAIAAPLVIQGPEQPTLTPAPSEVVRRPRTAETVVSTSP